MSNELKTTGVIARIFPAQQVSEKMIKQEFVIETKGQYPEQIKIETINKPELLAQLEEGDEVTVFFNLRGREWQGKYFVNLQAWKIETESAPQKQASQKAETPPTYMAQVINVEPVEDDLPF